MGVSGTSVILSSLDNEAVCPPVLLREILYLSFHLQCQEEYVIGILYCMCTIIAKRALFVDTARPYSQKLPLRVLQGDSQHLSLQDTK